jgi:hypothetical protein
MREPWLPAVTNSARFVVGSLLVPLILDRSVVPQRTQKRRSSLSVSSGPIRTWMLRARHANAYVTISITQGKDTVLQESDRQCAIRF